MNIAELIRTIPDYPKPGIMFRDITTLLSHPEGFKHTIQLLVDRYQHHKIDFVAGIEARGFILGAPLAAGLGKGFIPVRKSGKLPGKIISQSYELEYGTDRIEIHADAFASGSKILLVDDLIATGGTAEAATKLIERSGGEIVECCFIIDLLDLGGTKKLEALGKSVFALIEFEGD
ncbi:MAG: adenine phosphoribosyltransferase [Proteobacteria bacterium]|nr:adenine phosphoribosyltransferase [Pseudomonadota bacterium]